MTDHSYHYNRCRRCLGGRGGLYDEPSDCQYKYFWKCGTGHCWCCSCHCNKPPVRMVRVVSGPLAGGCYVLGYLSRSKYGVILLVVCSLDLRASGRVLARKEWSDINYNFSSSIGGKQLINLTGERPGKDEGRPDRYAPRAPKHLPKLLATRFSNTLRSISALTFFARCL